MFEIDVSDEFIEWYKPLSASEQTSIDRVVEILEDLGPAVPFPYSSGINGSRFGHMRELRIQHEGRPYRILYAFDPARSAYLIIGGDKTEMLAGTTAWCRWPMRSTRSISGR